MESEYLGVVLEALEEHYGQKLSNRGIPLQQILEREGDNIRGNLSSVLLEVDGIRCVSGRKEAIVFSHYVSASKACESVDLSGPNLEVSVRRLSNGGDFLVFNGEEFPISSAESLKQNLVSQLKQYKFEQYSFVPGRCCP